MCSTNVKLRTADVVQLNHDSEPWLYILEVDWSDVIEVSDVTRTVYISFVARAAACSECPSCLQCLPLLSFCDYPIITAEQFEGGQIALSLICYY